MLPRRHVLALDELSRAEAAALGPVLRAVTAALSRAVKHSGPEPPGAPRPS